MYCAVSPTARIARAENRNTSMAPSIPPMNTGTDAMFTMVNFHTPVGSLRMDGMSFTRDDVFSQRKPKFKLPKGYEDEWVFLDEMRKIFADNTGADRLNREASLEDLRFVVGDQWDDITRQRREAASFRIQQFVNIGTNWRWRVKEWKTRRGIPV